VHNTPDSCLRPTGASTNILEPANQSVTGKPVNMGSDSANWSTQLFRASGGHQDGQHRLGSRL
jgi:hypothetical protein